MIVTKRNPRTKQVKKNILKKENEELCKLLEAATSFREHAELEGQFYGMGWNDVGHYWEDIMVTAEIKVFLKIPINEPNTWERLGLPRVAQRYKMAEIKIDPHGFHTIAGNHESLMDAMEALAKHYGLKELDNDELEARGKQFADMLNAKTIEQANGNGKPKKAKAKK